jgi:hypothetical protein
MLGGFGLLCLSGAWALFWCGQLSHPMVAYYAEYKVLFILLASPAIIPLFWGTSLLDAAIRAPVAAATMPKMIITPPLQNFHIEPTKTESEQEAAGLTPDAPALPDFPDAAAETAEIKSPTPVAAT